MGISLKHARFGEFIFRVRAILDLALFITQYSYCRSTRKYEMKCKSVITEKCLLMTHGQEYGLYANFGRVVCPMYIFKKSHIADSNHNRSWR